MVLLPAAALPAHAAAPVYGSTTVDYSIPTSEGPTLFLEVVHPTLNGQIVKAPVILTYTPYAVLGRNGDAAHWTSLGYARATADVIGTGNSGGCWDYGGNVEKHTSYEVVEWIAQQAWNTGKIGMLGGSYEGTTQYAAAVTHPPHLTTIVPEAAIDRWYDYAYAGGIRYTYTNEPLGYETGAVGDEGVDTPFAFDFGLAVPPPVDATDPDWGTKVASKITPCSQVQHTTEGYSTTPDYDAFWQERDYLKDLGSVTIPVLVASNYGDWNVKQVDGWQAYHALTHSTFARMYFGSRWHGHGTPPDAKPNVGFDYSTTVDMWFAHFLMGADNGIENTLPPVTSATADSTGPTSDQYLAGPEPVPTPTRLYLGSATDGSWALTPDDSSAPAAAPAATFTWTGTNTESHAAAQPFIAGAGYIGFESPPLNHDVRLYGEPVLHLWSTVQRTWVTTTPSLLDFDPSRYSGGNATDNHALVAMTRGWLDSRYRDGLGSESPVTAGTSFAEDVSLWPTDYTVRAGHRLVLLVSTEIADWAIPKLYTDDPTSSPTVQLDYQKAQSYLTLPLVSPVAGVFSGPSATVPDAPWVPLLPLVTLALLPAWRRRAARRRGSACRGS